MSEAEATPSDVASVEAGDSVEENPQPEAGALDSGPAEAQDPPADPPSAWEPAPANASTTATTAAEGNPQSTADDEFPDPDGADAGSASPATAESSGLSKANPSQDTGRDSVGRGSSAPPELRHLLLKAENGMIGDVGSSLKLGGTGRMPAAGTMTCLKFYSWWFEDIESADLTLRVSTNQEVGGGLKRRYITVEYDVQAQSFSIRSADEGHELIVPSILGVTNKFGSTVEVWDLYVGATLELLGKSVTLLKAEIETSNWIEHHGKRLLKLKTDLQGELQKYKPRAHSASLVFDKGTKRDAGGVCLRYLVNQLNTMIDDLKQYRPQKGTGGMCLRYLVNQLNRMIDDLEAIPVAKR
eukprot:gene21430-28395_t